MASTHQNNEIDILTTSEYFTDLIRLINGSKQNSRILVSTMSIIPSERSISQLLKALRQAAQRGVTVDLAFDAQSFMVNPRTMHHRVFYLPNHPMRFTYGIYTNLRKLVHELEAAGVRVHITNIPKHFVAKPFSGRSHIKLAIVDNLSFVGGCNLAGSRDTDFMARSKDSARANWLYDTLLPAYRAGRMGEAFSYTDQSYQAASDTLLLLDSGCKKQSIIYDHAIAMIDAADSWIVLTCQFFPQGRIAQHLHQAHNRGVDVQIIYNHPKRYSDSFGKLLHTFHKFWSQRRLPEKFFADELPLTDPYLHAKILATEKGGIIGSHNYVSAGVRLGTAELAIHLNSPKFGTKLRSSVTNLLQK